MRLLAFALVLMLFIGAGATGSPENTDYALSTGLDVMQVSLSRQAPVINAYKLNSGEEMTLVSGDAKPVVRFCDLAEKTNHDSTEEDAEVSYDCKHTAGTVNYTGKLSWKDKPAIDFMIMITLSGNQLNITCQLLRERSGFQLLSVEMPPLLSVKSGKDARLVIPTRSGRLVDVEKSLSHTHEIGSNWIDPMRTAMVCDERILGILSVNSLDDKLYASVHDGDPKRGMLWVKFVQRPEASEPAHQFLAQHASTCTVTILGAHDKKSPTWMDAARLIRSGVKKNMNSLYTNSFIYKIVCDAPGAEKLTTFDDCLKLVENINALTGAKQVVYLVGWQPAGYPDVFEVNERLGGEPALKDLIARARGYGATVSLQDNYDETYEDNPAWDEAVIALDSKGKLAKGDPGAAGQPFILSPHKYAMGPGVERIRKTAKTYPVEKTVYLDVLSAEAARYDFSPSNPTGAQKNLLGKLKIIEQFKALGLNVTSKGFTSCFAQDISHFWQLKHDTDKVFSSEEAIPLAPFVYHGKISAGDELKDDEDMLRALLYGVTSSDELTKDTSLEDICDRFYLVSLPWMKLADKEMAQYRLTDDTQRIDYIDGSYVEINLKKNTYKVVAEGSTIGKDFTATVPLDKKTLAVYSRKGGDVSFTAPASWDPKDVKAYSLEPDGTRKKVVIGAEGRTLTLSTSAHVPYRVTTESLN